MEGFGGSEFTTECTARKKRSNIARRPRTDSHPIPNSCTFSPNDQNTVSACKDNGGFADVNVFSRNGSENKLKKVKLKFGGVTRTIHTNSTTEFAIDGVSFATYGCYSSDVPQPPKIQENIDIRRSIPLDTGKSLHGFQQKYFSTGGSGFGDKYSSRGKGSGKVFSANEAFKSESVRKSKRVPKRRVLDMGFSDKDEDEEIRYLEKLNTSTVGTLNEDEEDESEQRRRNMKVLKSGRRDCNRHIDDMDVDWSMGSSMLGGCNRTKPRSDKAYEDKDYMEDEEPTSDDDPKVERKTLRKESLDLFREGKKAMIPTTAKQANHTITDDFLGTGETLIDLPTGSLPAPHKKLKEKPSELEQQLKKTEAAQRRRLQSEKAAREAEAEAIRKILGQDSARKKREEKMKKQRDELAQGRAANNMTLAPSTVRWVMGTTGTIVTFSEDIGLPSIFNSVLCSYPPPREKCAGPNCTNSYKYRDSKSKLPLCSLLCYRAIHKEVQPLTAC